MHLKHEFNVLGIKLLHNLNYICTVTLEYRLTVGFFFFFCPITQLSVHSNEMKESPHQHETLLSSLLYV